MDVTPSSIFNSVLVAVTPSSLLIAIAALELMSALTIDPSVILELPTFIGNKPASVVEVTYNSKTISANQTVTANAEVITGTDLVINNGITLTIPSTTRLEVKNFSSGEVL